MTFTYGIKNTYRPSFLAPFAYGWSSAPMYNRADIPVAFMDRPANVTSEQLAQQFAYEWFQSGESGMGFTNPPFVSGAAGRLMPFLREGTGGGSGPARILRGYIRRAQYDESILSKARLYFMYNPEIISRDYVSYLDQGALDPFNTVYESGNLVAPPSILDFSFDLLFDRQEEATDRHHPGVFVDYQFFDMVVRNVIPTDVRQVTNTLPDNGVMMVNPRNITVVFSPQLTVEGRPLNARVTFERFTHRMVPIRMRISLVMRAVYLGPIRDMTEYRAEEFAAETAIPTNEIKNPEFLWSMEGLEEAKKLWEDNPAATNPSIISGDAAAFIAAITSITSGLGGGVSTSSGISQASGAAYTANYASQLSLVNSNNGKARLDALNWARTHVVPAPKGATSPTQGTLYAEAGSQWKRDDPPTSCECSGLVGAAYKALGLASAMGWAKNNAGWTADSRTMLRLAQQNNGKNCDLMPRTALLAPGTLQPGDLLLHPGHVAFFDHWEGNMMWCFDAQGPNADPQVGLHRFRTIGSDYIGVRPRPYGADMSYNSTAQTSKSTSVKYS